MKKSSCCKQSCGALMFYPTIVTVVVGSIMMTAGVNKFLIGSNAMAKVGGSVLSLFGFDASVGAIMSFAIVLGYMAAFIEIFAGFSFLIQCSKTSKYAAFLLAIVMFFALLTKFGSLQVGDSTGAFELFSRVLIGIRLDLLLLAIFIQKSLGIFCCRKTSCCDSLSEKSCCNSKKCDK